MWFRLRHIGCAEYFLLRQHDVIRYGHCFHLQHLRRDKRQLGGKRDHHPDWRGNREYQRRERNLQFYGAAERELQRGAKPRGYAFAPVSTAVTISGADVTTISFTATSNSAAIFSISGSVSGPLVQNVLISVTLAATTGTPTGTAVTASNGSYSFSVPAGTYTVVPSLSGYTFTPASNAVTLSSNHSSQVNFTEALAQ